MNVDKKDDRAADRAFSKRPSLIMAAELATPRAGAGAGAKTDKQRLGGLLVQRECWVLSFRGKTLVFLLVIVAFLTVIESLYPFLAVTQRTTGEVLVVEGWIHNASIRQVAREYSAAKYREVMVVAGVYAAGDKWDPARDLPEFIAEGLVRRGVPRDRVHVVFCEVVQKDRTYQSALAVKKWLREHAVSVQSIDIATLGPHARRSRILFQQAFGPEANIGVIALAEHGYDPRHWWRSSEGVREVLFEGFAYLYAKFLFWPSRD